MKSTRMMVVVAIAAAAVLLLSGVAVAQTFPDVDESNVHSEAIAWAAENSIVQGYENGNFGPFDNITRGQAASMFMRYEDYRMEDVDARRGCEDCHAGPYSLANEVPDGHAAMPADADINTCLFCHRIDPDGTGNIANISLRDIVHPVHWAARPSPGNSWATASVATTWTPTVSLTCLPARWTPTRVASPMRSRFPSSRIRSHLYCRPAVRSVS